MAVRTSPWSHILAAVNKMHVTGVVKEDTIFKEVGNGVDTRFWEDVWLGDRPLADRFPRLAALEVDRRCSVADRWREEGWSWSWKRPVMGGRTRTSLFKLERLLMDFRCSEKSDVWRWKLGSNGDFSVAETRC